MFKKKTPSSTEVSQRRLQPTYGCVSWGKAVELAVYVLEYSSRFGRTEAMGIESNVHVIVACNFMLLQDI